MYECTYTSQKNKKSKKWIDGFVAMNGKRITIHDDARKAVYATVSYKIEDGTIETPMYLVYTDYLEELTADRDGFLTVEHRYDAPIKNEHVPRPKQSLLSKQDESIDDMAGPADVASSAVQEGCARTEGRSATDVLDLFKK